MEEDALQQWQNRLLPFVIKTISFLTILTIIVSIAYTIYLQRQYERIPTTNLSDVQSILADKKATPEMQEFLINNIFHESLNNKRYHQAVYSNLSIVWMRFLGFIIGLLLAVVGSIFILMKLQESESSLSGENANVKLAFSSSSPGLFLVFFGVVLMITLVFKEAYISVRDTDFNRSANRSYIGTDTAPRPEMLLNLKDFDPNLPLQKVK